MRKKWKLIIGITVVIIVVGVAVRTCGKGKTTKTPKAEDTETITVTRGEIASRIEITGEVMPQTVVSLKSKVSGKIVKFYAAENEYVSSGQIIADIEPDYNQANTLFNTKAGLAKAEMQLANARKDLADKSVLLGKQ